MDKVWTRNGKNGSMENDVLKYVLKIVLNHSNIFKSVLKHVLKNVLKHSNVFKHVLKYYNGFKHV